MAITGVLLTILILSASLSMAAGPRLCVDPINKQLDALNYGSLSRPKPGVTKELSKDGGYFMELPGSPRVLISADQMHIYSYTFGQIVESTLSFDEVCNVTTMVSNTTGTGKTQLIRADVSECNKLRRKVVTKKPLELREAFLQGLCETYFPATANN